MTAGIEASKAGLVVLVHGAWHDEWCWGMVGERLSAAGVDWVAPRLPLTSMADDIAALDEAIADIGREHLIVGHSRGGVITSFAAAGKTQVKHLMYVTAQMLPEGLTRHPDRRVTLLEESLRESDGYYAVDPDKAVQMLYADCPDEVTALAVARLRPTAQPSDEAIAWLPVGWRTISSTYVVCAADNCIHPEDQRQMARNADHVVELPTGHSPQLARPDLLADLIIETATRVGIRLGASR